MLLSAPPLFLCCEKITIQTIVFHYCARYKNSVICSSGSCCQFLVLFTRSLPSCKHLSTSKFCMQPHARAFPTFKEEMQTLTAIVLQMWKSSSNRVLVGRNIVTVAYLLPRRNQVTSQMEGPSLSLPPNCEITEHTATTPHEYDPIVTANNSFGGALETRALAQSNPSCQAGAGHHRELYGVSSEPKAMHIR